MKKIILHPVSLLLYITFVITSCGEKEKAQIKSPEYNPDIAAFTSGLISGESNIIVRLASDFNRSEDNLSAIPEKFFSFDPSIEGKSWWVDSRTIEFRPDKKLPSGTKYKASFKLSKLFSDKNKKDFNFFFTTLPLNMSVDFDGIKPYNTQDLSWNKISGTIRVSDKVDPDKIEEILSVQQNGRKLSVNWFHPGNEKTHHFTIDSVERKDNAGKVEVSWNGNKAGIKTEGKREYSVPGLGDFILINHKIIQQPDQYIVLQFSDPLNLNQSLKGLISLSNNTDLKFSIEGNEIRVYPTVKQSGTLDLQMEPGIENIQGYTFKNTEILTLDFEAMKPAVRLIGNGVIIPGSDGILFPFEAVNLKAVDVKIIKIYEDNVSQFLQINDLNGGEELKRAGRLVIKKTIDLIPERPINFGEWNAFSLDLGKLVESEPGAIYRVELSFRKQHSLYPCPNDPNSELTQQNDEFESIGEDDLAYWDAGGYDYWYEYEDYDWDEKDNPCSSSYFSYYGRKAARNVLASNIGIIAKSGDDNSWLFVVTDLRTTSPLSGVKLNILNYQHQLMASLTTNKDGLSEVKLEDQPYLLIASKEQQRGYLRLDQNAGLSMSQFDVSGSQTQKGIKGFLFGERGVWRPGDTLHISFILEDKGKSIPADHPVVFEFTDPQGKLKERIISTEGLNGFYRFDVATHPDDKTGNWSAVIKIGGLSFYKTFKIETVKPNRLKIDLDFGKEMIYSGDGKVTGKLQVKWLHGAIAGGLKTRVEAIFSKKSTKFKGYDSYNFTDNTKYFAPAEEIIYDGNVNDQGQVSIHPDISLGSSPGMLNAIFTVRAFDQGGDFSINQFTIPVSPYPVYIGLMNPKGDQFGMLETDTLQRFDVVSLTEKGLPFAKKNLEVSIYKLEWQWWWHSADENLASYISNSGHSRVFNTKINTDQSGKGSFHYKVSYPDWGRFLIIVKDPVGGHSTSSIVYFDWPGEAGRASRKDPMSASILAFSSDKTQYNIGETATLSIPSGEDGRIFLSIENGSRILDHYWIKTVKGQTSFSFTITEEMTPNVYVNASLLQPHSQTKNDLPIRMYGVIPIMVEDSKTHLQPVISMPDVLHPESEAQVKITEQNGRDMTYTLAIVDEGLLDLTRFSTPDPWKHFYAKEALGIRTFDLYDLVLGAYGGRIDGVYAIGGGDDEGNIQPAKRANRFVPVVRFLGPFHLKPNKKNEHRINIPNYVGSVRTMVIARHESAYGNAEKTTPVRNPLMVLPTLPRVIGPDEEVSLPVTVFAMEDHIKDVNVSVEINDLFTLKESSKSLSFSSIGDKTIYFKLKVKDKTGIGKVKVNVTSGKEQASKNIEIDVRSPNPVITENIYYITEAGESWQKAFDLPGMTGTNSGILEVSSMPPFDVGRRLKSLLLYPYGCLEQVVSAAFPQLYLSEVMEVNDALKKTTEKNVKTAIEKMNSYSLPSGGFGYWPGSTKENEWSGIYAGHFLLEAKEKGYQIPSALLNNWIRFEQKSAQNWNGNRYEGEWEIRGMELTQAYRLYALALAGSPEIGPMNRLREKTSLNTVARWRLAAAYVLAGQKEVAEKMVAALSTNIPDYKASEYTYGSTLRDRALILETLTLLGKKEQAIPLMLQISEELRSDAWLSTQTTAYSLLSIVKYLGKSGTSSELNYEYAFSGDKTVKAATKMPVSRVNIDFKNKVSDKLSLKNNSTGTIYAKLSLSGVPLAGKEKDKMQNLSMTVEYRDLDGNKTDVGRMVQGSDFIALVTVYNPGTLGNYTDLALNQIFPSGWEIQNQRLFETASGDYDLPEYQDIRDDRVYSFFSLSGDQRKQFAVRLTASYEGRFYLPAVSCGAMYRNDVSAVISGQWVEVVKQD